VFVEVTRTQSIANFSERVFEFNVESSAAQVIGRISVSATPTNYIIIQSLTDVQKVTTACRFLSLNRSAKHSLNYIVSRDMTHNYDVR